MTREDPPSSELLFRYFAEVMILSHLVSTAFEAVMPDGMTMAQFGILNHLSRVGNGQSQVEIARAMQVRKSTMTSTLAGLQSNGYVAVDSDPDDRRSKRVTITEAGRTARAAAIASIEPEIVALSKVLEPSDVLDGLPILERVRKVLDARRN